MAKTEKTEASKHIVTVNPYAEGFLPKKYVPDTDLISADMAKEALDSLFSTNFEHVDSRAAEIIGSRGQKSKGPSKEYSFSELAAKGVKFGDARPQVRTAYYQPARLIEALDRHLTAPDHLRTDVPRLAYAPETKKMPKKPVKAKPPVITEFNGHSFDGPRPQFKLLMQGIDTFLKEDKRRL